MFKGFTKEQLISTYPLLLIAALSEELARTNTALETLSEQLKQMDKAKIPNISEE